MSTIITGNMISFYKLLTVQAGLKLECAGMCMSKGRSAYAVAKQDYGCYGNKAKVLGQVTELIAQVKADAVKAKGLTK